MIENIGVTVDSTNSETSNSPFPFPQPTEKKSLSKGIIIGLVTLALTVIGVTAGFYLVGESQDIRQQAAGIGDTIVATSDHRNQCVIDCVSACNRQEGRPDWCPSPNQVQAYCDQNATVYVRHYKCDDVKTDGEGCNERGVTVCNSGCVGQTFAFDQGQQCGTQQIDLGCAVPAGTFGDGYVAHLSYWGPNACGGGGQTYSCNSGCETNEQCQTANQAFVCHNGACRLNSNLESPSCQPPDGEPQYSCNSGCGTNEQCQTANPAFVCHQGACRLNSNLESPTCEPPVSQPKQISGRVYCSAAGEPGEPGRNGVPIITTDAGGSSMGTATTVPGGSYGPITLTPPSVGEHFAVRIFNIIKGAAPDKDPAFVGAGGASGACNPLHESCSYTSLPQSVTDIDFTTTVRPSQVAGACVENSNHLTFSWNMARDTQNGLIRNYIVRLNNTADDWDPTQVAQGGNPNDYYFLVGLDQIRVGSCDAAAGGGVGVCTVNTQDLTKQFTGVWNKPWASGSYSLQVMALSNYSSNSGGGIPAAELYPGLVELCSATDEIDTCTTTTEAGFCTGMTGTLKTAGTVTDENTQLTYTYTLSNPTLIRSLDPTINPRYAGNSGWVQYSRLLPPFSNGTVTGTVSFKQLRDKIIAAGQFTDIEKINEEGIMIVGNAVQADGSFCDGGGKWVGGPNNGQSCTNNCVATVKLTEPPATQTVRCESKQVFKDSALTQQYAVNENLPVGQTIYYAINIVASTGSTGTVTTTDVLPTGATFVSASTGCTYAAATRTVTCTGTTSVKRHTIAVRLGTGATSPVTNQAVVNYQTQSSTCSVFRPLQTYTCGSSCTDNTQCQSANADYVCSQGTCRLGSNPSSSTCQPAAQTYSCDSSCTTTSQCQTASSNYVCSTQYGNKCRRVGNESAANCAPAPTATPTPSPTATPQYVCNSPCTTNSQCTGANPNYVCYNNYCRLNTNPEDTSCYPQEQTQVGCNEQCNTNADCRNSNHVCYTTPDGSKRCRLENYVTSTTCNVPVVVSTPVPQQQPQLPQELPQTGDESFGSWVKAGLVTLAFGVGLLLLL